MYWIVVRLLPYMKWALKGPPLAINWNIKSPWWWTLNSRAMFHLNKYAMERHQAEEWWFSRRLFYQRFGVCQTNCYIYIYVLCGFIRIYKLERNKSHIYTMYIGARAFWLNDKSTWICARTRRNETSTTQRTYEHIEYVCGSGNTRKSLSLLFCWICVGVWLKKYTRISYHVYVRWDASYIVIRNWMLVVTRRFVFFYVVAYTDFW